jgi:two-component system, sporulation sensor kinase B
MHGFIRVESEIEAGTTFYIKFPTITSIKKNEN